MKCRYLMTTLGFDSAVDRHAEDFARVLQELCPDGIDIYFETETDRLRWVASADHDAAWPRVEGLAQQICWAGYDILEDAGVKEPAGGDVRGGAEAPSCET